MSRENEKVAIITGASRGIGAAVAERLAQDGLAVIINYAAEAGGVDTLASKIRAAGGRALPVQADVRDPVQVRGLFEAAEREFGGVDVVVNNAGIMTLGTVAEMDDITFDRLIAVNLKGTFNSLREASRRIRSGGRIINFSSSVVGLALPTYAVYAATKAGVEAMTAILTRELRGRNVTVNSVAPGPTATDLFLDGKPPEVVERMAKQPPLERLGQPKDIADVVSFLAGPNGGWINGQVLRANGGII
jgi:3-oxoacyl-[acyl-carrier protein] reductase